MADISKIQIGSETYDVKDLQAREDIESANQEINDLKIPKPKFKDKKVLLIGDSYGEGYTPDGNVTSWEDLFITITGLTNTIKKYKGGSGFVNLSSDNKTFQTLLEEVDSDNHITDIIILGGYNDLSYNSTQITNAMKNFKIKANEKFPNADIYVGMIGWSSNPSSIYNLNTLLYKYRISSANSCLNYLNNIEYSLHEYFSSFSSDGIHPNTHGQEVIARNLISAWLQGSCNVQFPFTNLTLSPATNVAFSNIQSIGETFINNVVEISNQSAMTDITFSGTKPSCSARNTLIELADITGGYIIGSSYYTCTIPLRALVHCSEGYINANIDLTITNKKLYLRFQNNGNSSGNNYQSYTNIDQIQLQPFQAVFNSEFC